ncbi:hypothetical protein BC629DRAFT_1535265 [Irpex lacteus]|nr:hypothetical protein BC629DRAFT_1535265 [Irpex lacteus]
MSESRFRKSPVFLQIVFGRRVAWALPPHLRGHGYPVRTPTITAKVRPPDWDKSLGTFRVSTCMCVCEKSRNSAQINCIQSRRKSLLYEAPRLKIRRNYELYKVIRKFESISAELSGERCRQRELRDWYEAWSYGSTGQEHPRPESIKPSTA